MESATPEQDVLQLWEEDKPFSMLISFFNIKVFNDNGTAYCESTFICGYQFLWIADTPLVRGFLNLWFDISHCTNKQKICVSLEF